MSSNLNSRVRLKTEKHKKFVVCSKRKVHNRLKDAQEEFWLPFFGSGVEQWGFLKQLGFFLSISAALVNKNLRQPL